MEFNKDKLELLKKLNNIESMIQEIYFMDEFDIAYKYEEQLIIIKLSYNMEDFGFTSYTDSERTFEFEQQLESIETEISNFIKEKENEKKIGISKSEKINNKDISTEEMWEMLDAITDINNKKKQDSLERAEQSREMAKRVIKILNTQAQRGERLELNKVHKYCDLYDFLFVIREKLIRMVRENKNQVDRSSILKMAKELDFNNVSQSKLWEVLTGLNNIKINEIIQIIEEPYTEEDYILNVAEPQKNLLQIIKEKIMNKLGLNKKIKMLDEPKSIKEKIKIDEKQITELNIKENDKEILYNKEEPDDDEFDR